MIDTLKSVGIEKGKPFTPDQRTEAILRNAVEEAHAWLDQKYEEVFASVFFDGARWAVPASREVIEGQQTFFADPGTYPVDGRGVSYSYAFFSAKHLGAGQFYLMTITDKDGQPFHGTSTYRLTIPPDAPVSLYWSATLYDRAAHALIREMPRSSRSSHAPDLQTNADGSTDLYFAAQAPEGKAGNWVPTNRDGTFEVLVRFYGPKRPLFDKTWQLPHVTKLN